MKGRTIVLTIIVAIAIGVVLAGRSNRQAERSGLDYEFVNPVQTTLEDTFEAARLEIDQATPTVATTITEIEEQIEAVDELEEELVAGETTAADVAAARKALEQTAEAYQERAEQNMTTATDQLLEAPDSMEDSVVQEPAPTPEEIDADFSY